jgi:hypothetical protein
VRALPAGRARPRPVGSVAPEPNYVSENPSNLGNFMSADIPELRFDVRTRGRSPVR